MFKICFQRFYVKYARISITHVCFIALTIAASLGRCLSTNGLVFISFLGTRQMLMHEKTCVIPIVYLPSCIQVCSIMVTCTFHLVFKRALLVILIYRKLLIECGTMVC